MNNTIQGKYRHFKGGVYEVLGLVTHSETQEELVLYRHEGEEALWVRPKDMFFGIKEIQGEAVQRFVKID